MNVKPFQDFIFTVRDYDIGMDSTFSKIDWIFLEQNDVFGFEEGQELLDSIVRKQEKDIDFSKCFEASFFL